MFKKRIEKFFASILVVVFIFSVAYFIKNRNNDSTQSDTKYSSDVIKIAKMLLSEKGTFLILFQNNMELRPGGGFIGSFAIVKTENGKVKSYEIHDTSNFDGRIPENKDMPAPMKKIFKIDSWKLRDSNYSPDYPTNAKKALDFYYQGKGEEQIDGVIAINAVVLESVLKVTGPIRVDGFPYVFESGSALLTLEKQVEKDFVDQGIERGDRKNIMNDFLDEIMKKAVTLPKLEKLKLVKLLIGEFKNKNIQLFFRDNKEGEKLLSNLGWDGSVDKSWNDDYLMMVDANLGSYKSDYFIKRSVKYEVDLSKEIPEANLKITYLHQGTEKNWMTRDYLTYFRLYIPQEAYINDFYGNPEAEYGKEFDKKFAGGFIEVPINTSRTVEIKYNLPKEFKNKEYKLKIQKQSGSGVVPAVIDIKLTNGEIHHFDLNLNKDEIISQ